MSTELTYMSGLKTFVHVDLASCSRSFIGKYKVLITNGFQLTVVANIHLQRGQMESKQ
jgi:hypothetical protein